MLLIGIVRLSWYCHRQLVMMMISHWRERSVVIASGLAGLSRVSSGTLDGVPGSGLALPALCLGFTEDAWDLCYITVENSVVVLVTVTLVWEVSSCWFCSN